MSTSLTCTAQGPVRASLEAAKVVCDKLGNTCTGIRKSEFTRHEIRACKSEKTTNDRRSSVYSLPGHRSVSFKKSDSCLPF